MTHLTESLNSGHRKNEFSCGKEMLDNYLHRQANQDIKRKLSACFVINDQESNLLQGYYTLANMASLCFQIAGKCFYPKKRLKTYLFEFDFAI
jgi:hypothetical protein